MKSALGTDRVSLRRKSIAIQRSPLAAPD